MPAKMSKISNELLPYQAGFAVVTRLDVNMLPEPDTAVVTSPTFLVSTQYTEGMTYEEVETGTGQAASYPTARTQTLAITTNTFSPIFHNAVTNKLETLPEKALTAVEMEVNLPAPASETADTIELTFGTGTDYPLVPAADTDGNYRFVIRDNVGNYLAKRTQATLGTFVYDSDTKKLSFSTDYANMRIRILYDYEDTNATVYSANPVLTKTLFKIETYGLVQDAETGKTFKVKRAIPRASLSGDIPSQPTQTSRSASLTYTFTAEPVPTGVRPYVEVWTPYNADGGALVSGTNNVVNGSDDNFTSTSGD